MPSSLIKIEEQRLDICLYNLRFCKTRSTAQALIKKGRVRVNQQKTNKASKIVRIGDQLTFPFRDSIMAIQLIALIERRVGAQHAQTAYINLNEKNVHTTNDIKAHSLLR